MTLQLAQPVPVPKTLEPPLNFLNDWNDLNFNEEPASCHTFRHYAESRTMPSVFSFSL